MRRSMACSVVWRIIRNNRLGSAFGLPLLLLSSPHNVPKTDSLDSQQGCIYLSFFLFSDCNNRSFWCTTRAVSAHMHVRTRNDKIGTFKSLRGSQVSIIVNWYLLKGNMEIQADVRMCLHACTFVQHMPNTYVCAKT